jgi:hypothetical protein
LETMIPAPSRSSRQAIPPRRDFTRKWTTALVSCEVRVGVDSDLAIPTTLLSVRNRSSGTGNSQKRTGSTDFIHLGSSVVSVTLSPVVTGVFHEQQTNGVAIEDTLFWLPLGVLRHVI